MIESNYVVAFELIYPQLHSAWTPAQDSCAMLDTETTKHIIVITLVTDIVLLIIMLAGLLYQRPQCYGMTGIGSLLLKQVGVGAFPWPWYLKIVNVFSVRKGIVWFLIATATGVPSAVSLTTPLALFLFAYRHFVSQVFIYLNLNGRFFSLRSKS
jgi:hypothetical protein